MAVEAEGAMLEGREIARAWRWLGDAWTELAKRATRDARFAALDCYRRGRRHLAGVEASADGVELDLALATTLAALADGSNDPPLVNAAIRALDLCLSNRARLAADKRFVVKAARRRLGRVARAIADRGNDLTPRIGYGHHDAGRPHLEGERLLRERLTCLEDALKEEMARPMQTSSDRQRTQSLLLAASQIGDRIQESLAGGRDNADEIDQATFRLGIAVQAHLRRHNLAIAPAAGTRTSLSTQPDRVFFTGRPDVRRRLEQICRERGLDLVTAGEGPAFDGRARDLLRSAAVALLDVGGRSPSDLADTSYQLGRAISFGVPTAILARRRQKLRLAVTGPLIRLTGAAHDRERLNMAIDWAACRPSRSLVGPAMERTVAALDRIVEHAGPVVAAAMGSVRRASVNAEPDRFRHAIEELIGTLPAARRPAILFPSLPPSYPSPGERRLLHAAPGGHAAAEATGPVESASVARGVRYVRSAWKPVPGAINTIWDDVGSATVVVAELSNFDPLVALAVGMAEVLGKPTLKVLKRSGAGDEMPARTLSKILSPSDVQLWSDGAALHGHVSRYLDAAPGY